MTVIARRFLASPARLSSATWTAIAELVCRGDSKAAAEFSAVAGIASCLINDRVFGDHPFVVKNAGPRLRIYCLYGEDSVGGDDKNEASLTWNPTSGEWTGFLPCREDDLQEFSKAVASKSSNFVVYDVEKGLPDEVQKESVASTENTSVDWEAFKKL